MRVRAAVLEDAPAMGRVMVDSFLSAHRNQIPEAAWRKRAEEWTPEVSARGWADAIADPGGDDAARRVLLVAEDSPGALWGLVSGSAADDSASGAIAEVKALYVSPDQQAHGVGSSLLRAAARELARSGFSGLQIGVLTANLPARGFYEAMGGGETGRRTTDEEGFLLPVTVYGWPDITVLSRASPDAS
jgi:GNAT superfamily N-acetyltransferase